MFKVISSAVAAAVTIVTVGTADAKTNMLFVLDSSGSMWGQLDGVAKIETAKTVLTRLMGDLPEDTGVGLMVYGHRDKGSCEDVELMAPIGTSSAAAAKALTTITPNGKTPIAYALSQTKRAFQNTNAEDSNHVVVISDGIETCSGDPCAVAAKLARENINVKVHVVGFDISAEDREQLQCIADNGNGRYFSADSTQGFSDAVAEAVIVVAAQTPEAQPEIEPEAQPEPEPQSGAFFFDDFDGDILKSHWQAVNPDPESYLVENGHLIAVATGGANLDKGNVLDMFKLDVPLPKGDWVATIQYRMPYQTGRETPFLSIYQNKDNHIAAFGNAWSYYNGTRGSRLYLSASKLSKGKKTTFNKVVWGGASGLPFKAEDAPNPFALRITKKGRKYTPAVRVSNNAEETWIEHETVTALRAKGQLAFGLYQSEKVNGETPIYVDWIKIEAIK